MKQIKDYPNYSITEDGVIFSNITNKVLTPFNSNGYLRIGLSKDNKRKKFLVHRLIAEAFIPNDKNNLLINHKDGNKMNNHISNLEWCTYSENLKHAYKIGLYTDIKKAGVYGKHTIKYAQKANEKIVLDTQTGIFYDSIKEAASILGINYWNIAQYLSGKRKNKTSLIYA
tara:strand:- start:44 stop:556 length:513 start_codon:yes stop_codon:yes gene_type:complete